MNNSTRLNGARLVLAACACSFMLGCGDDGRALEPAAQREAGAADAAAGARDATRVDAAADPVDAATVLPGVAAFQAALAEGRFADLPEVIAALERDAEQRTDDPEGTLALALAHLWAVAEAGRTPPPDPAVQGRHALAAEMHLRRARELRPDDARIDGWLGSVQIGIGRQLGIEAQVEAGFEEIARGVERDPAFNLFVAAFQHARRDRDDPEFARGAEAYFETAEVCGMGISAARPQLAQLAPDSAVASACTNGPAMPHNIEGFFVYGGDILLKTGDVGVALALYENATRVEGYSTWPHRAVIAQRLTDAAAWADRLTDEDPDNDPGLVWDSGNQCVLCHQR